MPKWYEYEAVPWSTDKLPVAAATQNVDTPSAKSHRLAIPSQPVIGIHEPLYGSCVGNRNCYEFQSEITMPIMARRPQFSVYLPTIWLIPSSTPSSTMVPVFWLSIQTS